MIELDILKKEIDIYKELDKNNKLALNVLDENLQKANDNIKELERSKEKYSKRVNYLLVSNVTLAIVVIILSL